MSKKMGLVFSLVGLTLIAAACTSLDHQGSKAPSNVAITQAVKTVCKEVPRKYAYFEARSTHWGETCLRAQQEAALQEGRRGSLAILERMVDDLYDSHASLNANNQKSPRLVPSGSDLFIEVREDRYIITAVRPMSGAAKAGVSVGDEFVSFNKIPPNELAMTRIHAGKTNVSADRLIWAINAAVAGTRSEPRAIEIRRADALLSFDLGAPEVSLPEHPISVEKLSENIGYVRFNNSLGSSNTVAEFTEALESLRQTGGIILDMRETPSGGNTSVAEPILGRFVQERTAYQRTVKRSGRTYTPKIKPTGRWSYDKPVVILVGRWTGSMGEGIAIGFDGMSRGKVMGSPMARLAGGTKAIKLKGLGISLNLPTYDLHHLNGTPRHNWAPPEIVIADNGASEDLLLALAINALAVE